MLKRIYSISDAGNRAILKASLYMSLFKCTDAPYKYVPYRVTLAGCCCINLLPCCHCNICTVTCAWLVNGIVRKVKNWFRLKVLLLFTKML